LKPTRPDTTRLQLDERHDFLSFASGVDQSIRDFRRVANAVERDLDSGNVRIVCGIAKKAHDRSIE
jgi:hypothetical protein